MQVNKRPLEIIYCGVGNEKLDRLAVMTGWQYGARLPIKRELPFPIRFADQDWNKPNLREYENEIIEKKPSYFTVLDWEREEQEDEVFLWLERLHKYAEKLIVIPKIELVIKRIPQEYNGVPIVLGYSVPTRYGKTDIPIELFSQRHVHLLGGSPHVQMRYVLENQNVVSLDCNYTAMKAIRFCEFWNNKGGQEGSLPRELFDLYFDNFLSDFSHLHSDRDSIFYFLKSKKQRTWYSTASMLGGKRHDAMYLAFFLSCFNYMMNLRDYYDI